MATPFLCKIIGRFQVYEAIVFTIERDDAPYGARTITLPPGIYYVLDDGDATYDLMTVIGNLVLASDTADVGWGTGELDDFTIALNGLHQVVMAMSSGQTATITWTGAETLRDWLRYEDTTTSVAFPGTLAVHQHFAGAYFEIEAAGGDSRVDPIGSVTVANDGTAEVNDYGQEDFLPLDFTFEGHDYMVAYSVYWYMRELVVHHLAHGEPVRIYFDVTVTTQRVEISNPYGWQEWFAPGEKWDPDRLEEDMITWHEKAIEFRLWIE